MSSNFGVCQFCNRKKAIRKNGTLVQHYKDGATCRGSGEPPAEQSLDALQRRIHALRLREKTLRDLHGQSKKSEDLLAWADAVSNSVSLERRLKRLKKRFGHNT